MSLGMGGRSLALAALVACSMILSVAAISEYPLTVSTTNGPVMGAYEQRARVFRGIRYAAPPTGNRRFAPPVEPTPWTQVQQATQFAPSCPQPPECQFASIPAIDASAPQDEDCLFLNVYTPRYNTAFGEKLPVMVFIHGGGFMCGSTTLYPGSNLALAEQVIVVTIAYRLNIFGSLVLPEMLADGTPVNAGMLDQQLALRWVNDNIKKFGGNPNNIMLFGESAGGLATLLHLIMPDSHGLFTSAVSQSPGPWAYQQCSDFATLAVGYANNLGCTDSTKLDCLRGLTVSQLLPTPISVPFIWMPCVGTGQLPDVPLKSFQDGEFDNDVPVIIGFNADEGNIRTSFIFGPPTNPVSDEFYLQVMAFTYEPLGIPSADVISWYNSTRQALGNWRAFAAADGDYLLKCGTHFAIKFISNAGADVYRYVFEHNSAYWTLGYLNATHVLEVPYVFHDPSILIDGFTGVDTELSLSMTALWGAHARRGDPSKSGTPWPEYDNEEKYLHIRSTSLDVETVSPSENTLCQNWAPYLGL